MRSFGGRNESERGQARGAVGGADAGQADAARSLRAAEGDRAGHQLRPVSFAGGRDADPERADHPAAGVQPAGAVPAAVLGGAGMTTAREIQALPPDIRADVEERAAIMEFDGGLTRAEAERAAV